MLGPDREVKVQDVVPSACKPENQEQRRDVVQGARPSGQWQ